MNLNSNKLFQRKNCHRKIDELCFDLVLSFLHKVAAVGRPFSLLAHNKRVRGPDVVLPSEMRPLGLNSTREFHFRNRWRLFVGRSRQIRCSKEVKLNPRKYYYLFENPNCCALQFVANNEFMLALPPE